MTFEGKSQVDAGDDVQLSYEPISGRRNSKEMIFKKNLDAGIEHGDDFIRSAEDERRFGNVAVAVRHNVGQLDELALQR